MIISSVLLKKGRITKTLMTKLEVRSLKYKICLTAFNVISFAIAGYCFLRHNAYCESGGVYLPCIKKLYFSLFVIIYKYCLHFVFPVYSLFAFFEYLVVLSNMAFHLTAIWDLVGVSLLVDENFRIAYR